jgi:acetolactate synthase-1/2/3 large subunit
MSTSPTCPAADLLVRRLAQWGVHEVFGYPGGQLTPIYDALCRLGGIRHRLTRHEQAAAFMADGYARASGRPGVCLAVCGPGVYNAATPLAAAHTDSIPVLLISGQVPRRGRGLRTGFYHENEQGAACAHFCKKTFHADDPAQIVTVLDDAWQTLTTGRPGPVLFEAPVDVLRAAVDAELPPLRSPPTSPAPTAAQTEDLARLVTTWQRPLILAGGGVVSAGAEKALVRLADRLGAPVFHTANGKCGLPGGHPLHAGLPWRKATSDLSSMAGLFSPLFEQADGLLAIGCRFTQLTTGSWSLKLPASLAQVDIDPAELGRHYPVTLGLACDARRALEELLEVLPAQPRQPWTAIPPRDRRWGLPGIEVLAAMRRALPADAILAVDVNRLGYVLMTDYPLAAPRTFLHPAGAVAMGYGLPAALGAKAAFPERTVVAVLGDGGFQMCALELATAMQEGLPVIVLLVNDGCLTLIKSTQAIHCGDRRIAVDLDNPDFGALTRAFGARYWLAPTDGALEEALREAVKARCPAVIEVRPADARLVSPTRQRGNR